jgi:hypothetical protein
MTNTTIGLTFLPFILVPAFISWTGDYLGGILLSIAVCAAITYAIIKYVKRKRLKEDLNRFQPINIVGMHPDDNTPPVLSRFAEDCEFVPHRQVPLRAKYWRDRLKKAGNPHNVIINEFSFMEPVDESAVNEFWSAEEGENNYAVRIVRKIEQDRAKVHTRQYRAGMSQYKGVVMGQVIEW